MPRSMWRGAISFGMVAIPVRMYLATESKGVSFRLLCPSCLHPIRNRRWCQHEDREVAWGEVLRGYEVGKDEHVVIDDADLERVPLPTTQTIEILEFVEDADIDAGVFVKSAYYLEPEAVGARPYTLLRRALEKTGRVAVAKVALRDREHLCRVAVHGRGLLMNTLHWPDEIRDQGELKMPEDDAVSDRELDMAVMLVDNLAARFDPARYTDDYRQALLAVVEEKLGTREALPPAPAAPPQVTDLMAALKASVEATRRQESTTATAEETAAPVAARRRRAAAAAETSEERGAAPVRRRRAS